MKFQDDSIKWAKTSQPVHPLIQKRWSPRAFLSKPIEERKLIALFEAARWAPSSYNEQPWRFIVGDRHRDPVTWERLYECLVEFNQQWCRNVPVLVLTIARRRFSHMPDTENRHAWHDVGLATAHLILQAMAEGLHVHAMGGFSPEKAIEIFSIPADDYEPVAMLAIGYRSEDISILPEDLQESERAPRQRKSLAEIVFSSRFGVSWNPE